MIAVLLLSAVAAHPGVMEACREDAQKLCAKVKPGHGRMIKCLKKQKANVSPNCAIILMK
jgi:Cysteine rich repeat